MREEEEEEMRVTVTCGWHFDINSRDWEKKKMFSIHKCKHNMLENLKINNPIFDERKGGKARFAENVERAGKE